MLSYPKLARGKSQHTSKEKCLGPRVLTPREMISEALQTHHRSPAAEPPPQVICIPGLEAQLSGPSNFIFPGFHPQLFVFSDLISVPEHCNLIRNMSEIISNLNSA